MTEKVIPEMDLTIEMRQYFLFVFNLVIGTFNLRLLSDLRPGFWFLM